MFQRKNRNNVCLNALTTQIKNGNFLSQIFPNAQKWSDYMEAYEDMLNKTTTEWAPWYIIPADKKWVAHASISEIILSQIKKMDLKYPVLSKQECAALEKAKAELEKE